MILTWSWRHHSRSRSCNQWIDLFKPYNFCLKHFSQKCFTFEIFDRFQTFDAVYVYIINTYICIILSLFAIYGCITYHNANLFINNIEKYFFLHIYNLWYHVHFRRYNFISEMTGHENVRSSCSSEINVDAASTES